MVGSIQITKFKFFQYHWRAISPNLMLAKVTRYTIIVLLNLLYLMQATDVHSMEF